MRTVRRISQVAFLLLFIILIVRTTTPLESVIPVDLFMRSSALAALSSMLAGREFIVRFAPAGVMVVVALLCGRVFCGWACPFGTTLDLGDRLLGRVRERRERNRDRTRRTPVHGTKYVILAVALTSAVFGVQTAGWVDPLSIATRTYTMVIHPYVNFLADTVLVAMTNIRPIESVAVPLDDMVRPELVMFEQPMFAYHWLTLALFVAIVALGSVERRYWCRHLCPLGALYDLLGRWAVLRRHVKDGCTHCNACVRACKMNAIEEGGESTRRGECVQCFTCNAVCPVEVSKFRWTTGRWTQSANEIDLTRRGLLASILGGLAAVPLTRLNFSRARSRLHLVRPPGVYDEQTFLAKCVRCGECMKVCVTNGLNPVVAEAGLDGMFTPRLVPRLGYCEYNCTLCGEVCPSGAIPRLFSVDEKHEVVLGTAFFDRNRCIPWAENRDCAVCEENCPVPDKAIVMRPEQVIDPVTGESREIERPYVITDLCVGCGICENKCPLPGEAGIRVGPRRREGPA